MGIPGLLTAAREVEKFKRPHYFKHSYFYIDGLNIISSFAKMTEDKSERAPYSGYIKKMEKFLNKLRSYNPQKIEFYFDTYYPIDKTATKTRRRVVKLKELHTHSTMCYPAILATKWLLSKGIRVIYTGLEAEDEIIKVIHDRESSCPGSRHIIFSSDSDLFTFHVKNPQNIDVISVLNRKINNAGFYAINIGEVHELNLVPKKHMRSVANELEGRSTRAVRPMGGVLSFVNARKKHGLANMSLALIYAPSGVSPHDIGLDIRRGTYGLLFRKWFDGETAIIVENAQHGDVLGNLSVKPLEGKELDDLQKVMSTYSLADIIENQFQTVALKYSITPEEIAAVTTYVNDLILGSKIRLVEKNHRGEVLFALLKALLASITGWEETLGGAIQEDNLLWRIDIGELSAYV